MLMLVFDDQLRTAERIAAQLPAADLTTGPGAAVRPDTNKRFRLMPLHPGGIIGGIS